MRNRSIFLISLLALFWAGCRQNDDNDCAPYELSWQSPAAEDAVQWLFLTDENGQLAADMQVSPQSRSSLSTEGCADDLTANFLSAAPEMIQEGSNPPRMETVYRLTTLLGVPGGLRWDTLAAAQEQSWEVAVNNVQSLEQLVWPKERRDVFQGDVFLDPAADLLSFQIQGTPEEAGFLRIKANGDTEPKALFLPRLDSGELTVDYETLPGLSEAGPVSLPGPGNWRYSLYGIQDSAQALIDYSAQPDLVSGSFSPLLPDQLPGRFRLVTEQTAFLQGRPYTSYLLDTELSALPNSLPDQWPDFSWERPADFEVAVRPLAGEATVYRLHIFTQSGTGPRIDWVIYGSAESVEQLLLPEWPAPLAGARADLLAPGSPLAIELSALQFQAQRDYQSFLQAMARKENGWLSENGLLQRTKAAPF